MTNKIEIEAIVDSIRHAGDVARMDIIALTKERIIKLAKMVADGKSIEDLAACHTEDRRAFNQALCQILSMAAELKKENNMTKSQYGGHGGPRPNSGPKTKANKGEHKAKKLSVTIPWSLWVEIDNQRLLGEGNSKLIQRLLKSLGE